MRLTKKDKDYGLGYKYQSDYLPPMELKLGQLEDLMEKYGFENVEDLDNFIQSCINRIEYEIKKEKYL